MAKANRKTLKGYFSDGRMPAGKHFEDLVDSMLNIVDDGLNRTENGLQLSPQEGHASVIEFFGHILDDQPVWRIEIDKGGGKLRIGQGKEGGEPLLVLEPDGKVEVSGDLKLDGRLETVGVMGSFAKGEVAADGRWHDITADLGGMCALQVMAGCGRTGFGKYAVSQITAMHCFGRHRCIRSISSWYGMVFNRIRLRWKRNGQSARLQIRTGCDYGGEARIRFEITELWHERDRSE